MAGPPSRTVGQTLWVDWDGDIYVANVVAILHDAGGVPSVKVHFNGYDDDQDAIYASSSKDLFDEEPIPSLSEVLFGASGGGGLSLSREDANIAYQLGYPHTDPSEIDDASCNQNLDFQLTTLRSDPDDKTVSEMHRDWFGDYDALEAGHGFIQWLFPIHEKGLNWRAKPLQRHEATAIAASPRARRSILASLIMMLDFFGLAMTVRGVAASPLLLDAAAVGGRTILSPVRCVRGYNWKARFEFLNYSSHNYLRITRILKCLGECGLGALKMAICARLVEESFRPSAGSDATPTLVRAQDSAEFYWIEAFRNPSERRALHELRERLACGGACSELLAVSEGCSRFARAQRQLTDHGDSL